MSINKMLVVTLLLNAAAHAANQDVQWTDGGGDNNWGNPANWSGDVLPTTGLGTNGDKIHINLSGTRRALYSAATGTNTYQTIRIGDSAGGELQMTGGSLASDYTAPTYIGSGGHTGTLNQSGGTLNFGGYMLVGLGANSVGSITLSGGTLISGRNGTVGGIPGVSLALGDGNNAQGNFVLSNGEFLTRTGVLLGAPGTTGTGYFEVDGGGIANIGLENTNDDGFWVQSSNSVLAANVEDGALGIIYVTKPAGSGGTYADGNVIFMPGSLLKVGFIGPPTAGTWDLMRWQGKLLTNGLTFAPGTDTNWHFAFVDTDGTNGPDTLRISYGTPAPTTFHHPGGLNTEADFQRMRIKVAAGAQPWLEDYQLLTANPHAQLTWTPNPQGQIVRAGNTTVWTNNYSILYNDIAAAYQCALRYQVSGDPNYGNKAVQIMNAWANTLTNINGDSDRYLAAGIYGYEFANVGEMMSRYSGWNDTDKARFKAMMLNVFYPLNHQFLLYHNNTCITHYWANWDLCNLASIIAIGVLCDDLSLFNEAVDYFKNGVGNGAIGKAVYYVFPGDLGQLQESGRDQGHATLDVALLGPLCQVAWNQGVDLYGYAGNRVLAGCEYCAQYNLSNAVPYAPYNNCDNVNQTVISSSGRGTIRPCWEMIYNHYVNLLGLSAPHVAQFAALVRPEGGGGNYGPNSGGYDQLGFGTLAYTIDPTDAVPPPAPPAPTGLTAAQAPCGAIELFWNAVTNASGYNVMRATQSGGPYTTLLALDVTGTHFTDATAVDGATYFYTVSAVSAGGESLQSAETAATAGAGMLPMPWTNVDIGAVGLAGGANDCGGTFTVEGAGADIGGTADSFQFACVPLTNNGAITARWAAMLPGGTADKVGLMLRATTDVGSPAVALLYDSSSGFDCVRLGSRDRVGSSMTWPGKGPASTSVPLWLCLTRTNNVFTGRVSSDGVNWTPVAAVTNSALPAALLAGLAVCSRDTNSLDISTFDNVAISGVWPMISLSPPQLSFSLNNRQLQLVWPADHTGWHLQAQTNPLGTGLGTNWFEVPGSDLMHSTNFPINPSAGSVFYRLVSP